MGHRAVVASSYEPGSADQVEPVGDGSSRRLLDTAEGAQKLGCDSLRSNKGAGILRPIYLLRGKWRKLFALLLGALRPQNALVVARNAADVCKRERWVSAAPRSSEPTELAQRALNWICHAQDEVGSGGVGSYYFSGWTAGYPEVTGYIIPTMWDYAYRLRREDLAQRARRMADWELSLQLECGGWEGRMEGDGLPPTVFNSGQVIRGLVRAYKETEEPAYLKAAVRGALWIVANQESDGSWSASNHLGLKRVYDTYVAAPLAQLSIFTGDERFAQAARRNCEFALTQQHSNGWFALCDNTPFYNHAPITHTICYTADGLLETGELLNEPRYIDAAALPAQALAAYARRSGYLPGRFDQRWIPQTHWSCLTGAAQLGLLLLRLHRHTADPDSLDTASKLVDFLAHVQRLASVGRDRAGAIPGSYPIWGLYATFRYPCWATKYFLDLLLAIQSHDATDSATSRVREGSPQSAVPTGRPDPPHPIY